MAFELPDLPEGVGDDNVRHLALSVLRDDRWDALVPLVDALQEANRHAAVARIKDALADLTAALYARTDDEHPRRLSGRVALFKGKLARAVWWCLFSFNSTVGKVAELMARAAPKEPDGGEEGDDLAAFSRAVDTARQRELQAQIRRYQDLIAARRNPE